MRNKCSNCSAEHEIYLRKKRKYNLLIRISRFGLLFALLGLWEFFALLEVIDSFTMSSPSRIVRTFALLIERGDLFEHMFITLYETIVGFLLATVIGTLVAIILWYSKTLRQIIEPYVVVLNSLPKVALGPIIIIWFGAGYKAIIVMAIIISVIITILTMLHGFLSCSKSNLLLLESMGATKLQVLTKLVLPHSLPDFISVLKINVGMSWVGTIMGEYLVSRAGLGYLIVYGGIVFNLDLVMTSTIILCALAGVMYFLVAKLEKVLIKWR